MGRSMKRFVVLFFSFFIFIISFAQFVDLRAVVNFSKRLVEDRFAIRFLDENEHNSTYVDEKILKHLFLSDKKAASFETKYINQGYVLYGVGEAAKEWFVKLDYDESNNRVTSNSILYVDQGLRTVDEEYLIKFCELDHYSLTMDQNEFICNMTATEETIDIMLQHINSDGEIAEKYNVTEYVNDYFGENAFFGLAYSIFTFIIIVFALVAFHYDIANGVDRRIRKDQIWIVCGKRKEYIVAHIMAGIIRQFLLVTVLTIALAFFVESSYNRSELLAYLILIFLEIGFIIFEANLIYRRYDNTNLMRNLNNDY